MERIDELIRPRHILDAAREAVELLRGRSDAQIEGDRLLILGLERLLGVVSEAAAQTPGPIRRRFPGIPWSDVIGIRNEILHEYSNISPRLVLDAVKKRFPPLIQQLEAALR